MNDKNQNLNDKDSDTPDVVPASKAGPEFPLRQGSEGQADSGQSQDDTAGDTEKLKAEREEYLAGWQRALADLQNFKKQVEKEKEFIIKLSNVSLLADILPIYNSLKKAAGSLPGDLKENSWAAGILAIKKQFDDLLQSQKISEIKTAGEKFDPNFHEAITNEESELPENEIIEEIEPGYLLEKKVLIPAKVRVSKGKRSE